MKLTLAVVASSLMAVACSSKGTDVQVVDVVEAKGGDHTEAIIEIDVPAAEVLAEVAPDIPGTDLAVSACDSGDGCFGEKCMDNSNCDSGWCVEHMGEQVCTQACHEGCPQGWTCMPVAGTEPEPAFVCISNYPSLCRPCAGTADCAGSTGTEVACISYGEQGSFCGGACGDAGECPSGFSCMDVETGTGANLQQCVNIAGVCPCTDTSVALGLWTSCEYENDFGLCEGQRFCEPGGLTGCDAPVPAPEVCNGMDDDCDGDADEPDLVEGESVDLCDDDNVCTQDTCLGEEGCEHIALDAGPCDDGNPCTLADYCYQGVCTGDQVQCDDGNPCTEDVCNETGDCEHRNLSTSLRHSSA